MKTEEYANKLLDTLIELDHQTSAAYYEMGQILHSIQDGKLWQLLGYKSYGHLIDEELSFSDSTAAHYTLLFRNFKRLHYNKTEALGLLEAHGITNLNRVLSKAKQKIGPRAIWNNINKLDTHQINFTLSTEELKFVKQALAEKGMELHGDRMMHSSEAFMQMIFEVLKEAEAA